MANPLSYYQQIAGSQPGFTNAEKKDWAVFEYKKDPESTYTGKRPVGNNPVIGNGTNGKGTLKQVKVGKRTDWEAFTNNEIIFVPATIANGVTTEAYIKLPGTDTKQPGVNGVALIPSGDGYELKDLTQAAKDFLAIIPRNPESYAYFKQQLGDYYKGGVAGADYKRSLRQPVSEVDTGFMEAIKNSLSNISIINYDKAVAFAKKESLNPDLLSYKSFVEGRMLVPNPKTESTKTSQLTDKKDSDAEFNRTVKQYIGNSNLVDKVDLLREAYWTKLHAEELRRFSQSTSTSNPLTSITNTKGFSWAPMTEQDRIEMRLKFIIDGDKGINSVGIKNATQEQLEKEGALVGAAYGKLKEVAADYGIGLTHADLLTRVYRALKPGGVTAGVSPSSLNTGLEGEANSIKQAAKVHFKGLEKYIDNGLKVSDITSNFQRMKENEMGLVEGAVDIYDDDVQKAVGGPDISSKNDFLLGVRSHPEWRFTPKANEAAATFLETIGKAWGKVG